MLTYQGCEQDYDAAETEDFIRQEFLDLAINSDRPVAVRDAANALVDEASENIRKYAQRLKTGLKWWRKLRCLKLLTMVGGLFGG